MSAARLQPAGISSVLGASDAAAAGSVAELEHALGDPNDAQRVFSYARSMDLDRAEGFPTEMCAELDRVGFARHYVPAELGGALRDFCVSAALLRAVARRDLTVAVAHAKTYLGCLPVWLAGSPEMAGGLARRVSEGAVVSLALTERGRGSDLVATATSAERTTPGGFVLSGEKWLVNNATRGDITSVLVRTDAAAGPRGLSLLLVDKQRLAPDAYTCTPKVPTHGIRGADISGIAFHGADVDADQLIGSEGEGLSTLLKSFQLSRTLCAGLSLGAADQALELATTFCRHRVLYGRTLLDLPIARRCLGEGIATLFVAEATTAVACRAVSALPGEMSVVSAVVKSFVPTVVDTLLEELGELLGARAFLLDVFAGGRFQKVVRDHRIVGIFDGSTYVNQNYLINQFGRLAAGYRRNRVDTVGLGLACALHRRVDGVDASRLTLFSRSGCSVVQALPASVATLRTLASDGRVIPEVVALAEELLEAAAALHADLAAQAPAVLPPAGAYTLAQWYEWCFAGAACLLLWLHNTERVSPGDATGLWAAGWWLRPALVLVLKGMGRPVPGASDTFVELADIVTADPRSSRITVLPPAAEADGA